MFSFEEVQLVQFRDRKIYEEAFFHPLPRISWYPVNISWYPLINIISS